MISKKKSRWPPADNSSTPPDEMEKKKESECLVSWNSSTPDDQSKELNVASMPHTCIWGQSQAHEKAIESESDESAKESTLMPQILQWVTRSIQLTIPGSALWKGWLNVNVEVYSLKSPWVQQTLQFTPLVLELSLIQSHLLWGEFSTFSAADAIHNISNFRSTKYPSLLVGQRRHGMRGFAQHLYTLINVSDLRELVNFPCATIGVGDCEANQSSWHEALCFRNVHLEAPL